MATKNIATDLELNGNNITGASQINADHIWGVLGNGAVVLSEFNYKDLDGYYIGQTLDDGTVYSATDWLTAAIKWIVKNWSSRNTLYRRKLLIFPVMPGTAGILEIFCSDITDYNSTGMPFYACGRMTLWQKTYYNFIVANGVLTVYQNRLDEHSYSENTYLTKTSASSTYLPKTDLVSLTADAARTAVDESFNKTNGVTFTATQETTISVDGKAITLPVGTTFVPVDRTLNATGGVTGNDRLTHAQYITKIDTKDFDTDKFTNMWGMFYGCQGAEEIDVSGFDTSKATTIESMFCYCTKVKTLDVSAWDTSNVTSMYGTFLFCQSLTSLDVSNFDTSKVTHMGSMFYNCQSLTSLDVSNFDTSKVTHMGSMFYNCQSLTSLDVSNFDTSKVTNMGSMFYNCQSLTSLDVSNFDTSKVTNMTYMFSRISKCETITGLSSFDTSNVTNISAMFFYAQSLKSIDLTSFDVSKATTVQSMLLNIWSCTSIIGNHTLEEVENGLAALTGLGTAITEQKGLTTFIYSTNNTEHPLKLERKDILAIINGMADLTARTDLPDGLTLQLPSNVFALLTDDDKAKATAKGWTIASY